MPELDVCHQHTFGAFICGQLHCTELCGVCLYVQVFDSNRCWTNVHVVAMFMFFLHWMNCMPWWFVWVFQSHWQKEIASLNISHLFHQFSCSSCTWCQACFAFQLCLKYTVCMCGSSVLPLYLYLLISNLWSSFPFLHKHQKFMQFKMADI